MSTEATPPRAEHPRIWWDGNDFQYLLPGPLLGQDGYDEEKRPGLYRARHVADISVGDVVELHAATPSSTLHVEQWLRIRTLSRLLRGMAHRATLLRYESRANAADARQVREEVRGLRLTVAAQVRQLGVLETVRLSSDRLIEDLRRQVAAAPRVDETPKSVADRLRAVADVARELRYGITGGHVGELATWVERDPELAAAVAAALSGEAKTP